MAVAMQPQESQLISGTFSQVGVSVVFGLVLNLQRQLLHCRRILKAWCY